MDALTPMMQQYHQIKREHPSMLLFFRLGDFYEMFYEDAVLASRELEIALTSRHSDRNGTPVTMCGVPYHSVDTYLARLIKKGYKVAICEQTEDPRLAKGLVRREVVRIVTPGTAIDEGVLEPKENNFIASLSGRRQQLGASFLDLSTGEFWLTQFSGPDAWPQMQQQLLHFSPRELVVPDGEEERLTSCLPEELQTRTVCTLQPDWTFNLDYSERVLLDHFRVSTLEGFGLNGHVAATSAAGALLNYVKQTQRSRLSHISGLSFFEPSLFLKLDEATVRNLELVRSSEGAREGTLFSTLDFTKTGMGARLLRSWILRPILDLEEINERLNAVEELSGSVVGMGRLGKVLKSIQDIERLISRVTLDTANARDLLALKQSLKVLPEFSELLQESRSSLLSPQIDLLRDVAQLLEDSIDDNAPPSLGEGGVIRKGFNPELDQFREIAGSGKSFIAALEAAERRRSGIASLKVKYNKVFGYFIEVTKAHLAAVPVHYLRKQTLVGAERFITPELKEYEEKVLGAEERIFELEKELFVKVRRTVALEAARIQQAARFIAGVDVLLSLAEAAKKYRYVRPVLDATQELCIRHGRHPVLELQGTEPFVPNDLYCNATTDQLLILTGPNMGGKSTYLRQNALIVILAQMGSFVPADKACIGFVDQIFTRVGASDNLARGRSTFMVEMIETANIVNTATPRSLVLLDEVGRGTATFDGLSLAWSVAEYLHTQPARRARTLFATHYHELTKLEKLYSGVKNYCMAVRESGQDMIFFHRVMAGVASKSYGIEVARLAGLPSPILERAREILTRLERKEIDLSGAARGRSSDEVIEELQKKLF